jgi:predicted GH43/DUF377 family glycosyl hydrolase
MSRMDKPLTWEKLGLVVVPDKSKKWSQTHAMVPTPILLADGTLRVFFTSCDDAYIGRVGFADLNPDDPTQTIATAPEPVLDIGADGCFDENGVIACSVTPTPDGLVMFYVGYELGTKIRYRLLTGAALSVDGGRTFKRLQATPVLERTPQELYFRCGPFGIYEDGNFKLWYVGGSDWIQINQKSMPVYELSYLESRSATSWPAQAVRTLTLNGDDEHGFGRPWVVKRGHEDYQLFYSIRKKSVAAYRMGYATSTDAINWQRHDELMGLNVSSEGFDSQAIMYAAVIAVNGVTYCFYNGNDFGRDGFAVARLVQT